MGMIYGNYEFASLDTEIMSAIVVKDYPVRGYTRTFVAYDESENIKVITDSTNNGIIKDRIVLFNKDVYTSDKIIELTFRCIEGEIYVIKTFINGKSEIAKFKQNEGFDYLSRYIIRLANKVFRDIRYYYEDPEEYKYNESYPMYATAKKKMVKVFNQYREWYPNIVFDPSTLDDNLCQYVIIGESSPEYIVPATKFFSNDFHGEECHIFASVICPEDDILIPTEIYQVQYTDDGNPIEICKYDYLKILTDVAQ